MATGYIEKIFFIIYCIMAANGFSAQAEKLCGEKELEWRIKWILLKKSKSS